jgi:hypothetical protein
MEDQFIVEMESLILDLKKDLVKVNKGNKAAILRYRKKMMQIKKLATEARAWASEESKK